MALERLLARDHGLGRVYSQPTPARRILRTDGTGW